MDVSKINYGENPEKVNAIIEIPFGSKFGGLELREQIKEKKIKAENLPTKSPSKATKKEIKEKFEEIKKLLKRN